MDAIVNDLALSYAVEGPPDGLPLLLIPGTGCSRGTWAPELLAALVGLGCRVITFDPRDTGMSSATDDEASYDLWDLADDARAVLEAAGCDRAVVLGHSAGAAVAQCLAVKSPATVRGLALLAAPARPGRGFEVGPEGLATFELDWDDHGTAVDALVRSLGDARATDETWARSLFAGRAAPMSRRSVLRHATAGMTTVPPRDEQLADVSCPVVVIAGSADVSVPLSNAAAIVHDMPTAQLVVVDGMGHWPGRRHLEQVASIVANLVEAIKPDTMPRAAARR